MIERRYSTLLGGWLALSSCLLACTSRDLDYLRAGRTDDLPSLCSEGGWCHLPDTKLRDVCPPNNAERPLNDTCSKVVAAANSGVFDSQRQRLIMFGGGTGETGHFGNETYALSLVEQSMTRLDDPSPTPICEAALPDGRPYPRSTHDSLAFVGHAERMLMVNGDTVCGLFEDTWTLDLQNTTWEQRAPTGPSGCDATVAGGCQPGETVGVLADYDPVTQSTFVKDPEQFWRYSLEEDRYERLREDVFSTHSMVGRVDPDRRLFIIMGCELQGTVCAPTLRAISIDPDQLYADFDWTNEQRGCDELIRSGAPGLAYDVRRKLFVGWPNRGDDVYLFDPDTKSCTVQTYSGGPQPSETLGTFGRFRYMPGFDAFVVVFDIDQDAAVLRLR